MAARLEVANDLDLNETLTRILSEVLGVSGTECGAVSVLDSDMKVLDFVVWDSGDRTDSDRAQNLGPGRCG
jgi:hypothetical protein